MAWLRRSAMRRPCVAHLDDRCRLHLYQRGCAIVSVRIAKAPTPHTRRPYSASYTNYGCGHRYATALLDQPGRMESAAAAVRQVAAAAGGGWVVEERSAASHPLDEAALREMLGYAHSPRYIERQLQVCAHHLRG